eukprot:COSAG05_NODE_14131_length_406_cov_18.716612_1_plen_92_part_10
MRQISGGHEIRPRGGLLLVTTLHFYLYRYFPIAIDRSIREHSFLENLHMGNQGVSEAQKLKNPATRKNSGRATASRNGGPANGRLLQRCIIL